MTASLLLCVPRRFKTPTSRIRLLVQRLFVRLGIQKCELVFEIRCDKARGSDAADEDQTLVYKKRAVSRGPNSNSEYSLSLVKQELPQSGQNWKLIQKPVRNICKPTA